MARFSCSSCSATLDLALSPGKNPTQMVLKAAQKKGWDYKGRWTRWFCPDCLKSAGALRKGQSKLPDIPTVHPDVPSQHETPAAPPANAKVEPEIKPSGKQWFEVLSALEICFNRDDQRYEDDYTDVKVAKETKIPVEIVKFIRESEYGELRPDPHIESLQKSIEYMREQIDKLLLVVDEQQKEIDALRQEINDADLSRLDALVAQVKEAKLPETTETVKTLRAQVGKGDLPQCERMIRSLRAQLDKINLVALEADVDALKAQIDGKPIASIIKELESVKRQVKQNKVPAYEMDELLETLTRAAKGEGGSVYNMPVPPKALQVATK